FLTDRQTQSGPRLLPRIRTAPVTLGLHKLLEDVLKLIRRDADPGITNAESNEATARYERIVTRRVIHQRAPYRHRPAGAGEFHSVRDEVGEYLSHAIGVANVPEIMRLAGAGAAFRDPQSFRNCLRTDERQRGVHRVRRRHLIHVHAKRT